MKTKYLTALLLSAITLTGLRASPVDLTATPERTVLPDTATDCVVQIELTGRARPADKRTFPLNLALVLDRSSSMSGDKIEQARRAACVAVDQLEATDIFSLVIYDNEVEVLIPPARVTDKPALHRKINQIVTRGSTALHGGVKTGAEQVRKFLESENVNRVILLSDGQANVGPSSPDELARLGRELVTEGITISTVGLGEGFNEDLMTALAESAEGNYYYVSDVAKLAPIFADELGTVKSIVARNLQLRITLPDGVTAKGILGEDAIQLDGGTITIPVADLSGTQTRRFLLDCHVAAGTDPTTLADVTLEFTDPETGKTQRESRQATAQRSADLAASDASVQAPVLANSAVTRNRLAKEKAVALADSGKPGEAALILRQQAAANAALPATAQSPLLKAEQQTLESRAASLESTGSLSNSARKSIHFENYLDKKQKR